MPNEISVSELSKISELAQKHGVAVITAYQGKRIDFRPSIPMLNVNSHYDKRLIVLGDKITIQEFSNEYNDFPNGLGQHI